jgi:membrane-associated phospholipid phosphatase
MNAGAVLDRTLETLTLAKARPSSNIARHASELFSGSARGGGLWLACSALLWTRGPNARAAALDGMIAWSASEVLACGAKRAVDRKRPKFGGRGAHPRSTSMPSSHATGAWAYAFAAGTRCPPVAVPLTGAAVGVAWSRVALGRHFASDVIVGCVLGISVGAAVAAVRRHDAHHGSDPVARTQ